MSLFVVGLCLRCLAFTNFCSFFVDVAPMPLSKIPSLGEAIPICFLKTLSPGGYDIFIFLIEDLKAETACSWAQFLSPRWDKVSELPSGNSFLLETGPLLGKRVWESVTMAILPPSFRISLRSCPWESSGVPGKKVVKIVGTPCDTALGSLHSASSNFSKLPFKDSYQLWCPVAFAPGKQIFSAVSCRRHLALWISRVQLAWQPQFSDEAKKRHWFSVAQVFL